MNRATLQKKAKMLPSVPTGNGISSPRFRVALAGRHRGGCAGSILLAPVCAETDGKARGGDDGGTPVEAEPDTLRPVLGPRASRGWIGLIPAGGAVCRPHGRGRNVKARRFDLRRRCERPLIVDRGVLIHKDDAFRFSLTSDFGHTEGEMSSGRSMPHLFRLPLIAEYSVLESYGRSPRMSQWVDSEHNGRVAEDFTESQRCD